jgi:galactokinase
MKRGGPGSGAPGAPAPRLATGAPPCQASVMSQAITGSPPAPAERASTLFRRTFAAEPQACASAPGRVNLIGEHVDYHGGLVLPVATAWRTAVAVGPAPGGFAAVSENGEPARGTWPPVRSGGWSDYVAGVAAEYLAAGPVPAEGVRVAVASDVPLGAGVSSSAALEVAAAGAFAALFDRNLEPRDLAALAHRAETGFVGVPCGVMDQMASALTPAGSALLLDCRSLTTAAVPVGLDLVLAESGESHELRGGQYAVRRREGDDALARLRAAVPALEMLVDVSPAMLPGLLALLPPPLDRRVRHVVNENQRTVLAARALEAGDLAAFGRLVDASHDSLRDLYECSTARLDTIVAAARRLPEVLGARLVGAGWGGAVLVVVTPGAGEGVAERLRSDAALALPAVRVVRPGAGLGG